MIVTPDGQYMILGADLKGNLIIFELKTGKLPTTIQDTFLMSLNNIATSADGKTLATITNTNTVKIHNLQAEKLIQTFRIDEKLKVEKLTEKYLALLILDMIYVYT